MRPDHRLPQSLAEVAQEKDLDLSARRARPDGPRREDARVVQHEQVARAQESAQVAKDRVLGPPVGAMEHHQPRRVARLGRTLRDHLRRELVIVTRDVVLRVSAAIGRLFVISERGNNVRRKL